MEEDQGLRVDAEELFAYCSRIFEAAGVPADEAKVVSHTLVDANLAGLDSHGVSRVATYLSRLDKGLVSPMTGIRVVSETAGSALIDAGNGWGQVASDKAVSIAVRKARETGVAWVGVSNSNHNGTAAYWTRKIAAAGMAGISGTNASPVMAPFGSRDASLGTNPLSIAVPSASGQPVVLDMATSVQARGKILLAAKNGENIPEGWAVDSEGNPTTDAHEALAGTVLPVGGPKGSGLAIMVDILSGVLTGATFGAEMPSMYEDGNPQRLGHFFIALDISAMMPLEVFLSRMSVKEDETRGGTPAPGFERVLMPGDVEAEKTAWNSERGVVLSRAVHDELMATARQYGITATLGRVRAESAR